MSPHRVKGTGQKRGVGGVWALSRSGLESQTKGWRGTGAHLTKSLFQDQGSPDKKN